MRSVRLRLPALGRLAIIEKGDVRMRYGEREPELRCLACGYDLQGLSEHRCPECALPFDPTDASHRFASRTPLRRYILLIYLGVGLLCLTFWATADSSRWAGYGYGVSFGNRLLVAACQLAGPNAFWMLDHLASRWWLPVTVTPAIWAIWLTAALVTPVRRLPLTAHAFLAVAWCFAGCGPTGLIIT